MPHQQTVPPCNIPAQGKTLTVLCSIAFMHSHPAPAATKHTPAAAKHTKGHEPNHTPLAKPAHAHASQSCTATSHRAAQTLPFKASDATASATPPASAAVGPCTNGASAPSRLVGARLVWSARSCLPSPGCTSCVGRCLAAGSGNHQGQVTCGPHGRPWPGSNPPTKVGT